MSFRMVGYLWSHVPSGGGGRVISGRVSGEVRISQGIWYTSTPPGVQATAAVATHPVGMLSCIFNLFVCCIFFNFYSFVHLHST